MYQNGAFKQEQVLSIYPTTNVLLTSLLCFLYYARLCHFFQKCGCYVQSAPSSTVRSAMYVV